MSLLEDVFLEDEAGEAHDLERVIEGDGFEEHRRSDDDDDDDQGNNRDDEAEEDKRRVDPTAPKSVRVVKNPRFVLNPARLTGPRGIHVIPEHFKDFKFKGKGHEKEDLDLVLKKLEHWTYRLYPKFKFADCLKKIEALGKKRPVTVHLHKIRSDQFQSEETVVQQDSSDEETPTAVPPEDEFDKLLQQQIDISRTMTPAPGSARKGFSTPGDVGTPFAMPKATSSPSISEEQKERMIRNRRLAEERRLARLKQNSGENLNANGSTETIGVDVAKSSEVNKNVILTKRLHSNGDANNTSVDLTESSEIDKENHVTPSKRLVTNVDVNDTLLTQNAKNDNNGISPSRSLVTSGNSVDLTEVNASKQQENIDNDLDDDTNISSRKTSHRSNIIDSSDEDSEMVAVNTSSTVCNHMNSGAKDNVVVENFNRREVMDSSDDEQDSRIVNQSVIVDIHKSVYDDSDKTDNGNNSTSKTDGKSDNEVDKNVNLNTVNNQDGGIEIPSVPTKELNDVESEVDIVKKTDAVDSEIMDIDFGDDF